MAKHRTHSIEFKRQIAQNFIDRAGGMLSKKIAHLTVTS